LTESAVDRINKENAMPKFLIEREIPDASSMPATKLKDTCRQSSDVMKNLGSQIHWIHSYVTGDKIYCIYVAPNEEIVRQHAEQCGLPANRISRVENIIDATTGE
jgi:hypothetical protein